jgi:predicted HTH transcriptional regulator
MAATYRFDGETFDAEQDGKRLSRQLDKVLEFLLANEWVTLSSIANHAKCSESSASARLRDLRKPRFGSLVVERKRSEIAGIFLYRLVVPITGEQLPLLEGK